MSLGPGPRRMRGGGFSGGGRAGMGRFLELVRLPLAIAKAPNIEHPTSNIERRRNERSLLVQCWTLDVGRWMFDVQLVAEGQPRLNALPITTSRQKAPRIPAP